MNLEDDPALLQAIGLMTVTAAGLEFQLAYLTAVALDEDEEWLRQRLASPGAVMRELQRLVDQVPAASEFGRRLRLIHGTVSTLLGQRHAIVHSVAMIETEDQVAKAVWWHPRTDQDLLLTAPALSEFTQALRLASVRAIEASALAVEWRTAARPQD